MINYRLNKRYKLTILSYKLSFWAILALGLSLLMIPTTTLATTAPIQIEITKPVNSDKQAPKSVPLSAGTIQFERSDYTLREGNSLSTQ